MTKYCSVCEKAIRHGDKVVAVVSSTFVDIPSEKSYAIEKPTECYELQHEECQDLA